MAATVGALSALPLLFLSALAIGYAGSGELPPLLWLFLPAVTAGLLVGAAALRAGRSWRLLVGAGLGALLTMPVAVVGGARAGEAAEAVLSVTPLVVGPALAALLGSAPDTRRWVSRTVSHRPADHQPAPGEPS